MTGLLDGVLADMIADGLGPMFLDATLTRMEANAGDNDWTPGTPFEVSYDCKAMHDAWGASTISGGLVDAADRKVMILASTLSTTPIPGDRINIRDETFIVVSNGRGQPAVTTDPAQAVWTIRARK